MLLDIVVSLPPTNSPTELSFSIYYILLIISVTVIIFIIIGLIISRILKKKRATQITKIASPQMIFFDIKSFKCSYCGYATPLQFKKCTHCGAILNLDEIKKEE